MASVKAEILLNQASITADVNGSALTLPNGSTDFALLSQITFNSGTSTLDANVQTSGDGGTTWVTVASITQVGVTSANEVTAIASNLLLPLVRINVDVGGAGSPDYDALLKLFYREVK